MLITYFVCVSISICCIVSVTRIVFMYFKYFQSLFQPQAWAAGCPECSLPMAVLQYTCHHDYFNVW